MHRWIACTLLLAGCTVQVVTPAGTTPPGASPKPAASARPGASPKATPKVAPSTRPASSTRPSPAGPVASPAGDAVVFSIGSSGGLCPDGPCGTTRTFYGDGRFEVGEHEGTIDPALVHAVAAEIARADFAAIKAKPFTGGCPTAYDGQEFTYVFPTAQGEESLGTCQYDLDGEHPLFAAAWRADEASEKAIHDASPQVVLIFDRHGGRCPDGECTSSIMLHSDGGYSARGPGLVPKPGYSGVTGEIDRALVDALVAEMKRADFAAIKAKPFTGTCPTAFDGQESSYDFYTSTPFQGSPTVETIASCTIAVDPAHPLFAAADRAIAAVEGR